MNGRRVPFRGGVVPACLCLPLLLLAACDDEGAGPAEDAFDPAGAAVTLEAVTDAFQATELPAMVSQVNLVLTRDGSSAGGPARLPNEGHTYVFDVGTLSWKVDPALPGAPADGLRFAWYVMDTGANSPRRPLVQRGWVDVRLSGNGETTAVMTVEFVGTDGGASVTEAEYEATFQADGGSGSFALTAQGTAGRGAGEVAFDVTRSFTYAAGGGLYEETVTLGGDMGFIASMVEIPFDPATHLANGDAPFHASVVGGLSYLLVDAVIDVDEGLDGFVEADEAEVLTLEGTLTAPVFRLPGGGVPTAEVQQAMSGLFAGLWQVRGAGSLVAGLESLFR